jgi:SAM-dependent methyltransferase
MANFILKGIQTRVNRARNAGVDRCCDWAGRQAVDLQPASILDVGCGDGSTLFRYFKTAPQEFYGIEGSPECQAKARERGLKVSSCDLNGRWPYDDNKFDVVFSNQVIEHVHNCRLFAAEAFRVLKPGGTALVTSENLCSLLNWMALSLGYTPFSLMQTCGRYLGNPLGIHYQEAHNEELPLDHPAFSGVSGHVRVLTVRQARELFDLVGFETEAHSIGILPLPDGLSRVLEGVVKHRGHFLNIRAHKPIKPAAPAA